MKNKFLGFSVLVATACCAHAATITWGPATNATGVSDVRTTGTLVEAQDPGNAGANRTINGVTFTAAAAAPFGQSFGGFGATAAVTDATYNAALTDGSWDNQGTEPITFAGLILGRPYQVQLWVSDTRTCCSPRMQIYDSDNSLTAPGSVTLHEGSSQFAVGTFIADAITQSVFNNETNPAVGPQVNLYQLRLIPEPATISLFGLLGGLSLLRRRR